MKQKDDRGLINPDFAIAFALVICVLAAGFGGIADWKVRKAQSKVEDAIAAQKLIQQELARVNSCTENVMFNVTFALTNRGSFNEKLNDADLKVNESFEVLIGAVLQQPPLSEKKARLIFTDYLDKLHAYVELVQEFDKLATYPTPADYRNCLERAKKERK